MANGTADRQKGVRIYGHFRRHCGMDRRAGDERSRPCDHLGPGGAGL